MQAIADAHKATPYQIALAGSSRQDLFNRLNRSGEPLDAMRSGLPESCGVALGIDRLAMLALGKSSLTDVIAFDSSRA